MSSFIHADFMLQTKTAENLYHNQAENLPIIDYHCHLVPKEIAEDHKFSTITELWLGGDHYKWRLLRANGVSEKYITGDASDWEKFEKWAATVPYTMRNPMYHWTHLELKRVFDIDDLLNPDTALDIFNKSNEMLQMPEYTARGLMKKFNVEVVCTTDDPLDSLEYHKQIKESGFEVKVLPTWRPDKSMAVENIDSFRAYVDKLSEISGIDITDFEGYSLAIAKRHDYFQANGCKLADHGIDNFFSAPYTDDEVAKIFDKIYNRKESLTDEEFEVIVRPVRKEQIK